MRLDYRVNSEDNQRRAGRLAAEVFHLSRHDLALLKQSNGLLADGQPVRQIDRLSEGMILSVLLPDASPRLTADSLHTMYEDDTFRIIDKPAGIATMSSVSRNSVSVEKLFTSAYGDFRPVNRLDKGTGGLMICASTAYSQHLLSSKLHSDDLIREYIAVVEGIVSPSVGSIDLPIGHMTNSRNLRCVDPGGKPSKTYYRVLCTGNNRTLLRLRLITGRTHQIRVHLSAIGHPVCGDYLYGSPLPTFKDSFALHSAYLFIRHPLNGTNMFFKSNPPQRFFDLLKQ